MPWRKAWQPTPVFLPGESTWTEEPGGLQSMGLERLRHDWMTKHVFICVSRNKHLCFYQFIYSSQSFHSQNTQYIMYKFIWSLTKMEMRAGQREFYSMVLLPTLQGDMGLLIITLWVWLFMLGGKNYEWYCPWLQPPQWERGTEMYRNDELLKVWRFQEDPREGT